MGAQRDSVALSGLLERLDPPDEEGGGRSRPGDHLDAPALHGLDVSLGHEQRQRLAHRVTGAAELLGQGVLRGEQIKEAVGARVDAFAQGLEDLVVLGLGHGKGPSSGLGVAGGRPPGLVHTSITSSLTLVTSVAVRPFALLAGHVAVSTSEVARCVRGWKCERAMSTSSVRSGASHGRSRDAQGPIGSARGPIKATRSSFTLRCMAVRPGTNTCQDPRRKHHAFGCCLGPRLDPLRRPTDR